MSPDYLDIPEAKAIKDRRMDNRVAQDPKVCQESLDGMDSEEIQDSQVIQAPPDGLDILDRREKSGNQDDKEGQGCQGLVALQAFQVIRVPKVTPAVLDRGAPRVQMALQDSRGRGGCEDSTGSPVQKE